MPDESISVTGERRDVALLLAYIDPGRWVRASSAHIVLLAPVI